jgi:hypothetical protein
LVKRRNECAEDEWRERIAENEGSEPPWIKDDDDDDEEEAIQIPRAAEIFFQCCELCSCGLSCSEQEPVFTLFILF